MSCLLYSCCWAAALTALMEKLINKIAAKKGTWTRASIFSFAPAARCVSAEICRWRRQVIKWRDNQRLQLQLMNFSKEWKPEVKTENKKITERNTTNKHLFRLCECVCVCVVFCGLSTCLRRQRIFNVYLLPFWHWPCGCHATHRTHSQMELISLIFTRLLLFFRALLLCPNS